MERLGSDNLLGSLFVQPMGLCENKNIEIVNSTYSWLDFKDNDYALYKYRSDRTQSVEYPELIDLKTLKEIVNDLVGIYKKEYPFAEKEDFIKHVFESTLNNLRDYCTKQYTMYGCVYDDFVFYYFFDRGHKEFIDTGIPVKHNFEFYIQYFKKVIKLIEELDFDMSKKDKVIRIKNPAKLRDIFVDNEYDLYLQRLVDCKPKLLERRGNSFAFVGIQKTQRGVIAQYFKYLKSKGIINQNINRAVIAEILSNSIEDFSISGSSIDNESTKYMDDFRNQLEID